MRIIWTPSSSCRAICRAAPGDSLETLLTRLQARLNEWDNPTSELNKLRQQILRACVSAAANPKGIYTLTVPTGGGKTTSSLAFALHHAVEHGMKRVIYVVPYTSIIEQNADVFRGILGDENVLEHHSGVRSRTMRKTAIPIPRHWPPKTGTARSLSQPPFSFSSRCTLTVPHSAASCTIWRTA